MHAATYLSFLDELQKSKTASSGGPWSHAAELGGLGMLAAPTIQKMRGKPMKEKNKDRMELGGLGVLAAPTAIEAGKGLMKKMKGVGKVGLNVAKHASVGSHLAVGAGGLLAGGVVAGHLGRKKGHKEGFNRAVGGAIHRARTTPEYRTWHSKAKVGDRFSVSIGDLVKDPDPVKAKQSMVDSALSLFQEKEAAIHKEALFGLGEAAKAVAKTPFKPSFAGHAKSLGLGASTAKNGVTTARSLSLGAKNGISQKKFIEIPGLS